MIDISFVEGPWHGRIEATHPLVKAVHVEGGTYHVHGNQAHWEENPYLLVERRQAPRYTMEDLEDE